MDDCLFCSIVSGDVPSRRVYEDDATIAFLDIAPATRGHTLVIPRDHATDLWSISAETVAAVARTSRLVAHLIRDKLRPTGMNLVHASGAAAGQEIFHFHAHLVPRYDKDGVRSMWSPAPAPEAELDEVLVELTS